MIEKDELAELNLPELLVASRLLLEELASRMSDPRLPDSVDRFPDGPERDRSEDWGLYAHADTGHDDRDGADPDELLGDKSLNGGSLNDETLGATAEAVPVGCLPVVLSRVEELGRWVDAARTGLAGHVDQVFDEHAARRGMLESRRASVPIATGRTTSNKSCASPVMRRRSVFDALSVSCRSCHRTEPR
ncbi:hypothetical protein ACWG8W_04365 [Citricoccus zhacaiensis]